MQQTAEQIESDRRVDTLLQALALVPATPGDRLRLDIARGFEQLNRDKLIREEKRREITEAGVEATGNPLSPPPTAPTPLPRNRKGFRWALGKCAKGCKWFDTFWRTHVVHNVNRMVVVGADQAWSRERLEDEQ